MSRRKPYEFREPAKSGPVVWRSLEDKVASPSTRKERAESEAGRQGFVGGLLGSGGLLKKAAPKEDLLAKQPRLSRRGFLATTGTAAAALSLQGCVRRPEENILPYVRGPEYSLPGIPTHFATVTERGGDSLGILVTSHQGRPTKIEGNSAHPSSRGATDLRGQAFIWDLYDPDRSRFPVGPGFPAAEEPEPAAEAASDEHPYEAPAAVAVSARWAGFDEAFGALVAAHEGNGGQGLRILTQPSNSPSFQRLRGLVKARFPQAKFHTYAPITDRNVLEGARIAFGQPLAPIFDFQRADVVVALDSDFLGLDTGNVRAGSQFGPRRAISNPDSDRMNRLYSVEATFSSTGASADHRLRLAARDIGAFLKNLAVALKDKGLELDAVGSAVTATDLGADAAAWLEPLATDIIENRGRAPIVVGPRQPAAVHALAHSLNHALGNFGQVVDVFPPVDSEQGDTLASLRELVSEIDQVTTLVMLGGNPVYDTPGDVNFTELLGRDGLTSVHLASHFNETSEQATWHVPETHELETWGDQRAIDGTLSIQQPLIAPIWGARSALEVLGVLSGERNWRSHYVVRKTMRERIANPVTFEREWRRALHRGVVAGSANRPVRLATQPAAVAQALGAMPANEGTLGGGTVEVRFLPDPALFDGRYANNLWCLECPDPMTKLSWDNAALMSKTTRDELGLSNGQIVRLSRGDKSIEVPVWALPGHADNSVSLNLGWGRTRAGRYGNAQTWPGLAVEPDWKAGGFDVQAIRGLDGFDFAGGVSIEATGEEYELIPTQEHGYMEGRPIAIEATVEEYKAEPEFASYRTVELTVPPLWETQDYSAHEVATGRILHKWGMVIDLSSCTGCNACLIACQAENNIPAVGKQEVKRGREMHWLRIDRYFVGDSDADPQVSMQPVGCQQCEEAPCENVCPVNATVHSEEGLNDMAYNRCIGTRYCANNCPYKVRRFNYLDWHNHLDQPWSMHGAFPHVRQMGFNPNVTVRMRGVMEKCSYCVQRIQEAKFRVRREHRQLRDGDIAVACESACASRCITFGDLNDPNSRVTRLASMNRQYKLLAEIGARPRTTYLGRIRNPNPAFAGSGEEA